MHPFGPSYPSFACFYIFFFHALDNKKKKNRYANKNYKKDKKILPTNNLKR